MNKEPMRVIKKQTKELQNKNNFQHKIRGKNNLIRI
jgi:hypothetical protein